MVVDFIFKLNNKAVNGLRSKDKKQKVTNNVNNYTKGLSIIAM